MTRPKSQVAAKAQKLAKYRSRCNLLIVLIENDDLANMSRGKMIKAVEESYHNPCHMVSIGFGMPIVQVLGPFYFGMSRLYLGGICLS